MPDETPLPIPIGQVVAGKYRLERLLGAGGMGAVVAATHVELGGRRAIKFLLAQSADNENAADRFMREARAAARLSSEHVIMIHDVGRLDSGEPFMVMEHLEGENLEERLRERGRLGVTSAVLLVLQALEAIAEAHAAGIVHRDLKPANLFVCQDAEGLDFVKVLDFGISKVTEPGSTKMTRATAVFGSPDYMSPEQMVSSADVDPRSDIWSIGVLLYELLTGTVPFLAESITGLCMQIMHAEAKPITAFDPELPAELDAVVRRCLGKDRADRYQDVAELAAALVPFGGLQAEPSLRRVQRWLGKTTSLPADLAQRAAPVVPRGLAVTPPTVMMAHQPSQSTQFAATSPSGAVASAPSQQPATRRGRSAVVAAVAVVGVLVLGAALLVGLLPMAPRDASPGATVEAGTSDGGASSAPAGGEASADAADAEVAGAATTATASAPAASGVVSTAQTGVPTSYAPPADRGHRTTQPPSTPTPIRRPPKDAFGTDRK